MEQKAESKKISAIIGDVFPNRGYGIAYVDHDQCGISTRESISFSLSEWPKNQLPPRKGQCLTIKGATKFSKGWRADAIELVTTDSIEPSSMEQR